MALLVSPGGSAEDGFDAWKEGAPFPATAQTFSSCDPPCGCTVLGKLFISSCSRWDFLTLASVMLSKMFPAECF